MKNLLQLEHTHFGTPDHISVVLNATLVYSGAADIGKIELDPKQGQNSLQVILDKKQDCNFRYDAEKAQVVKNSHVLVKELVIHDRYFRSLLTKCGLVEIDIKKNLHFPSKYIDHENCLTMEGSIYLIKFDLPIKNWMQIHLHGRDLDTVLKKNRQVDNLRV
jgi:hypothetical protein